MARQRSLEFDKIGNWSETKIEIIKSYAEEYSKILSAQKNPPIHHMYIDAFAGAGVHISKADGREVAGTPLEALAVKPPFREYFFIDLNDLKVANLQKLAGENKTVHVLQGDCNKILREEVFPRVQWNQYKRALCLLDPYGLHLDWEVIEAAGKLGTIEIFFNFPIADMNRNVIWRDPDGDVDEKDIQRMNAFWGDDSWRSTAYTTEKNLFGYEEKEPNLVIAEGFRDRLKNKAGFKFVSQPLAMRNSNNAVIYYLFFAAQKPVSKTITDHIFKKYGKI